MNKMASSLHGWNVSRVSETTWKMVEADKWGQIPFVYIIVGTDKIIVIDTGTGQHNLFEVIESYINKNKLPYMILLTHIHFDHIGGVQYFPKDRVLDVCLSSRNKTFSENYESTCLCLAHPGATIKDFKVTRWLDEDEIIYLDDLNKVDSNKQIKVIHTPGHTPDSVTYWFQNENRLFVGDLIYPFTSIHVDCLGSDMYSYVDSLIKLRSFCQENEPEGIEEEKHEESEKLITEELPTINNVAIPKPSEELTGIDILIQEFCSTLGLLRKDIEILFDPALLMELCGFSVSDAVEFYLMNTDSLPEICPPSAEKQPIKDKDEGVAFFDDTVPKQTKKIKLSCGHVESNLCPSSLDNVLQLIELAHTKELLPVRVEDSFGEFQFGNFNLVVSTNHDIFQNNDE